MPGFVNVVQINPRIEIYRGVFPFTLPVFKEFNELAFHSQVTFLIGENGSGKSTLMEAIATALGMPAEGGTRQHHFSTYDSHSDFGEKLIVGRNEHPGDTLFLRAETFYNLATYLEQSGGRKFGRLHQRSHGEGFLDAIDALRGHGLYLMDEPESALSIQGQLTFLVQMKRLVDEDSQFIIATHSPIILGFGRAWIYQFTPNGIERVRYQDTDHYKVTLDFLKGRGRFSKYLGLDELGE